MARKVFISVLGTGFYGKCVYFKDDFKSTETRFIQRATLEMLTRDESWNAETDKGFILLTEKAKTANWLIENNYRLNYQNNKEKPVKEPYTCLHDELIEAQLPLEITPVDIPDGKDEREMWEIFEKVFSLLKEGDELYFDVTHGFRYLPMLVLVLGNYAKFLRNAKVKSLTYGNYEVADKRIKPELAPFVDITPLSVLQDWTFSGASFTQMGKVSNFTESLKGITSQLGIGRNASMIGQLNRLLNTFEGQIATCRGREIMEGKEVCEVQRLIRKISKDKGIPRPLQEILARMNAEIADFSSESFDNLVHAIKWCERYGMIQQGYTLCQESVITYLCQKFADMNPCEGKVSKSKVKNIDKEREKSRTKEYREYWSSLLGLDRNKVRDESSWRGDLGKYRDLTRAWLAQEWVSDFRNKFEQIRNKRNQLNHAGFVGKVDSEEIMSSFKECVSDSLALFEQELTCPELKKPEHSLFINLSNHPSSLWGEGQLAEAKKMGEIVDMVFPVVNPCATTIELDEMAQKLVDDIRKLAGENNITVHVMGEMSLTYKVVQRLISWGIRCVCSTTQRIVTEDADGRKVTEFHFEQFRDYE